MLPAEAFERSAGSLILDFHTHAFPEKIAGKAMSVLSKNSGNVEPLTDGTAAGLLAHMDSRGVEKAVVLGIATNPRQQKNVNDFAASICSDRLIAFGSVHPDAPDALEELHRIHALGLRGVKFHPEYQDFFVDEKRMLPIYELCDRLGLVVVFHAGVDIGYPNPVHCPPKRLAQVLSAFPKGRVVAAHFGGYALWTDVETYLAGKNLYLDTSYSYSRMPGPQASAIVQKHGADRILFGSDLPWSDEGAERRFVDSFAVTAKEREAILGFNAMKLLGL